jgi:hypothetical protein
MKKALLLFLLDTIPAVYNVTAQPKNQNTKNTDKSITISVKGIEYDNPSFDDLRKSIKGNMKVKQSSPGFTGDVAKIILLYQGTATELWDELPQSSKQNFKIISIDDSRIELQLKTSNTQTVAKTTEIKKEDCIDCHYYKACYDDTSVVFDGNVYKGNKKKNSYYFCKNGTLYSKTVSKNQIFSQIIFKANEPVGTNWIDTFGTTIINKTTISKGIGIRHGKTYYDDVMIVYFADNSLTANYYYVKGSGFIKYDSVDKAFNPSIACKINGNIDTTLIGSWRNYNEINKTNYYYKFNGDGTFAYYSGIISKEAQMPQGTSIWRAGDNYIELYNGAWSKVSQVFYKKKNDPITGKPAIAFGSGNNFVYFISDDEKPAWK